jgi:hypothetical protein
MSCRYCRKRTEVQCLYRMDMGYSCTREWGHPGPHVACRWPGGPHDLLCVAPILKFIFEKKENPNENR